MSHKRFSLFVTAFFILWWSLPHDAFAVQFGAGTGSSYPVTLDSTNPRANASGYDPCSSAVSTNACAEFINDIQDAVTAVETELGVNPSGSYTDVKSRLDDLAPKTAKFWVGTADATLSDESNLGALSTGLVLNTVTAGVGVPSTYPGAYCTNKFIRSLSTSGASTCATVGSSDLASGLSLDSPMVTTKIGLPRVTSFPSSPSAGDTVIVTDDSAVGACDSAAGSSQSLCQYNGSAWVSLGDGGSGGSTITAVTSSVTTEESLSSGTGYQNLTTNGPEGTLTVGPCGCLEVSVNADIRAGTVDVDAAVDFALSSGNTRSATDTTAIVAKGPYTGEISVGRTTLLTGLSQASTVVTMKYERNANTAYFKNRTLNVKTW